MNRIKKALSLILALTMIMSLAACGGGGGSGASFNGDHLAGFKSDEKVTGSVGFAEGFSAIGSNYSTDSDYFVDQSYDEQVIDWDTANYDNVEENRFMSVKVSPLSTFGADVDTTSYANVRRMLKDGQIDIPKGAIRTEEFINYFTYNYNYPEGNEPFAVDTEIIDCPWNDDTLLMRVGVQTPKINMEDAPPCNLVFLIDTSGSMYGNMKLGLVQKALSMLTNELDEKDRVSIVTYAGTSEVLLEGAKGTDKDKIISALESLGASGGTNGADGIVTAYDIAKDNYIINGTNRVILCTDGELNIGITNQSDLVDIVKDRKQDGIFLSTIGVGDANYNDSDMEALADKGDGNYNYLDSILEAKKVLVDEMGGTLITVAKDAKFQIEFNPSYIKAYRQIGYENRQMAAEDFADDTKDGGEIGAGQQVTVLYEIVPVDSNYEIPEIDMKYNNKSPASDSKDWLNIAIRYKVPSSDAPNIGKEKSELLEFTVDESNYTAKPSNDTLFASYVAAFAMKLRDSEYVDGIEYSDLIDETNILLKDYTDSIRVEFLELLRTADALDYTKR